MLRWGSDGVGGGAGVVGNPNLGACRWFPATDNCLDITTCAWRPLRVAFSLGQSPVGDCCICTNPVGGLGVTLFKMR